MTAHHFSPTMLHNSIGSHAPVLTIASGDTVTAETADAHGFDHRGIKIGDRPNPMTGPFFVAGAEPGDALLVTIRGIRMTRSTGWTFDVLSPNVVDPSAVHRFPARRQTQWLIDAQTGRDPPDAMADRCPNRPRPAG